MIKTFTRDDVIRLVYNEMSEEEELEINQVLVCDSELQDTYKSLVSMKLRLDRSFIQPSQKVIDHILNYSKSLNLSSKE